MNTSLRFAALATVLSAALPAPTLAQLKAPFEVKSGVLETTSDMPGLSRTAEVLYFDDFGRRQAHYTTTTMNLGEVKVSHALKIDLPDGTSYDIDLDEKTGTRMRFPPEAAMAMAAAMTPALMKDAKVKDLPGKEILGKPCKGTQAEAMGMVSRTWTWKGLALRSEVSSAKGGGDKPIIIQATKVTEGPVAAEKFRPPANVKVQDLSQK